MAEKTKSSMSGDLFDLLKQDHQRIMNLFTEIIEKEEQSKDDLFSQIQQGLDLHMKGEESYLYPVLEGKEDANEMTLEAFEEHHVSKTVLDELSSMSSSDEHWMPKVKVLKELISHHVEEEENELFPLAQDILPEEQVMKIGKSIKGVMKSS